VSLEARIKIGFNKALKLLKMTDLVFAVNTVRGVTFKRSYSHEFMSEFQKNNYAKIYEIARENYDYDILLENDSSLFQFSYIVMEERVKIIRYAFYECPKIIICYEEFLKNEGFDIRECDDSGIDFYADYEQYKSEAVLKQSVTPIRYDYDESSYDSIKHPVSHIHIGLENDLRIPVRRIMMPKDFVAFVLRHIYYSKWKEHVSDREFLNHYCKSDLRNVDACFFDELQESDYYLV